MAPTCIAPAGLSHQATFIERAIQPEPPHAFSFKILQLSNYIYISKKLVLFNASWSTIETNGLIHSVNCWESYCALKIWHRTHFRVANMNVPILKTCLIRKLLIIGMYMKSCVWFVNFLGPAESRPHINLLHLDFPSKLLQPCVSSYPFGLVALA